MEEFSLEELIEIKKALNTIKAQRLSYEVLETNEKRLRINDEYKRLDDKLLKMFVNEIDNRKKSINMR